ncbi:glycosyltransferase family 2 protein [Neptuniibacter pectenicola]|uniref:glycosyltransferase family 2 protein n=1 Tax=Neptuniibacter pectenicola TaxID=1806669 RepID=UPI000AB3CA27|nr:glycosyltransferase family 2 protein [Neptuniibacter pectenicola]
MYKNSISVVIPFFKAGIYADQLIKSLSEQTFKSFEIIIVNDGKGEGHLELNKALNKYGVVQELLLLSTVGFQGPAAARNLALSVATADVIAFLDADDTWDPDFLNKAYAEMKKNDSAILVSEVFWISSDSTIRLHLPEKISYQYLQQTCPIQPTAILINRKKVGFFDFPKCHHEDYALWLTLTNIGFEIDCLNEPLVYINRVSGSVSSNKIKAFRWHWAVLCNYVDKGFLSRLVLFSIYAVNAVMKRSTTKYCPVVLPSKFINFLR